MFVAGPASKKTSAAPGDSPLATNAAANGVLADAQLEMDLSFDASIHIRRAISLVKNNLGLGLMLAIGVLYFLMRSRRATFLVTATVPLSLLVAFVALRLFDKTLNVISLAGLAFAVGLVMDAAIVTLENIVRCRQNGLSMTEAAAKGTRQITGALFASTVTSVAIFLPVLFMEGMEGQLFQDLALTIAVAAKVAGRKTSRNSTEWNSMDHRPS